MSHSAGYTTQNFKMDSKGHLFTMSAGGTYGYDEKVALFISLHYLALVVGQSLL